MTDMVLILTICPCITVSTRACRINRCTNVVENCQVYLVEKVAVEGKFRDVRQLLSRLLDRRGCRTKRSVCRLAGCTVGHEGHSKVLVQNATARSPLNADASKS